MKTQFYILLSLKTSGGFTVYGQYFLGDDREAVYTLFGSLKGNKDLDDPALLHIDLMEMIDELPVKIRTVCCTLDELGCNSKLIVKAIFRQQNLKEWDHL